MNNRAQIKTHAYTPGLKIMWKTVIRKERKLPIKGEVLVKLKDQVSFDDIVAKASMPGDPHFIKASSELGVPPHEIKRYMIKNIGDNVHEDEILAKYEAFFGLYKKSVCCSINGKVESISEETGRIIIRGKPKPVFVKAYIPGEVVKVLPGEGVLIEREGAFIQGILGIGGECHGKLKIMVDSPDEVLNTDTISTNEKGCVLVGGSHVSLETIKRAIEVGAIGIVTGGIDPLDLSNWCGKKMGVAITGEEKLGLTLIITEGFGKIPISKKAFNILKFFEGHIASLNGTTQIRAGVIRPEIIIPHNELFEDRFTDDISKGMSYGTLIRIIREPYFGEIGRIMKLPIELQKIDTQSLVRVLEAKLENGRLVRIPRANVEIIEE